MFLLQTTIYVIVVVVVVGGGGGDGGGVLLICGFLCLLPFPPPALKPFFIAEDEEIKTELKKVVAKHRFDNKTTGADKLDFGVVCWCT